VEQHFACTACGKCCYGWLPLTLKDALVHAGRFPLALIWKTVPHGTRTFPLATRLGITLKSRKRLAVLIMPTAYIPPSLPCPELMETGGCAIHENKPQRCRTMPFYPYREESDQTEMLKPRKGWLCDTTQSAPLVYRKHLILAREDFDLERLELIEQAETMRQYADYMFKYSPWILDQLNALASNPNGHVITSLSSFLTAIKHLDSQRIATQQLPVLTNFSELTSAQAELTDYHRNYAGWAKEMAYLSTRSAKTLPESPQ
jgi:Fe-S-cluster containining protein